MYQQYLRAQDSLGTARLPYKDVPDLDESMVASPPLELRRPGSGPRTIAAVPHSMQSPQDRATGTVF